MFSVNGSPYHGTKLLCRKELSFNSYGMSKMIANKFSLGCVLLFKSENVASQIRTRDILMPSALCELTSMIKPFYSSSLHSIFAPLDRKALFGVRADNNSCHSVRAPYMQSCVERAKSPFSKWLKTSDPGAKLCGELLSFPLSRRPVIHARSVCFCAAACGKQDRGVERRPLFEAHLQVNDI